MSATARAAAGAAASRRAASRVRDEPRTTARQIKAARISKSIATTAANTDSADNTTKPMRSVYT
jgi:hypothetical protein